MKDYSEKNARKKKENKKRLSCYLDIRKASALGSWKES